MNTKFNAVAVCDKNIEKLEAMLRKGEGKATCRTVGSYKQLAYLMQSAEESLRGYLGDAKSALYGIKCTYVAHEKLARAYTTKYTAYATYIDFYFDTKGVAKVSKIGRTRTGWTDREWYFTFTDVHKERIMNRAGRGICTSFS